MKQKLLKSILLLCALVVGSSSVWADVTYSLTPNQTNTGSEATTYITTLTEFTYGGVSWKMNQWNPKTLQIKTNQSSAASEFRFYNTSAFAGKITKVVITFSALTVSDASKLMFLGGTSEVTATTGGTAGTWNSTNKTLTWTPGASDNFTYFAFYQNGKAASGTNNLAEADAIVVTYAASDASKVSTPSISGTTSFLNSTEVSITCSTDGAAIQYSTDNGENWEDYSVPFTLTSTTTVKAKATKDGLTDSDEESQTFTKITPMTVAEALTATSALPNNGTLDDQYVRGKISKIDSYNSTYHSITYYISDDGTTTSQLEVYSGKGLNGDNFTAESDLELGDDVVVYGTLKNYNSTFEFDKNSQIISLYRTPKYVINFAAAPVAGGTIDALDSKAADVASGDKFVEGETLTLSATANTGYTFANWTATGLTIAEADKTKNDLDMVMPANEVTLTANFTANTYVLTANSAHGALTVMVDGAEWNGTDEIAYNANVSIAVAAEAGYKFKNWTITGATLADDTAEPAGFTMPAGDVTITANFDEMETRPVNWFVNGTKIRTDNVAVGEAITFTAPDDVPAGYVFQYWSSTEIDGVSATEAGTKATAQTAEAGDEYNYYAVIAELTGTKPASWTAEELENLTSSDVFVIVGTNGTSYALANDGGTSSSPAAPQVTISDDNLTSSVTDDIKWTVSGNATDGYTFYPNGSTETWLYCINDNKGVRVGTNVNKTFKVDNGYLKNVGQSRYIGVYNIGASSQDWRCYTSINDNIKDQIFTYYKYVAPSNTYSNYCTTLPTATITIAAACTDGAKYYGTYSNSSAFIVPADLTVSAITVVGTDGKLTVADYAEGDIVKANTGVLVSATSAGEKTVMLTAVAGTEKAGNMLKASGDAGITASAMNEADTKFYRLTMHNGTQIGFWWGAESGAAFDIAANKAYLAVPNTGAAREGLWLDFGGETTGVREKVTVNSEKFATAPVYNLNGQRVSQPTRGLYIVNGRKVLVP